MPMSYLRQRGFCRLGYLGTFFAAFFAAVAEVRSADDAELLRQLKLRVAPLLQEHCLDCHSGAEPDAGLTLDHFDSPLSFLKGRAVWEKAVQKMVIKEMPPPDASSLSDEDRKFLVEWIGGTIENYECGLEPNPGTVTLRRLNAREYRNTIRAMFSWWDYEPAGTLGGDDVGYGFDNIGDVLTLPPLLMEKYFLEAERITQELIQVPPVEPPFLLESSGAQLQVEGGANSGQRELVVASASQVATLQVQVPWTGTYQLTVTVSGDQVGDEPVKMRIDVDDKPTRMLLVPRERSEPLEEVIELRRLRTGNRKIKFYFENDLYVPAQGDIPQQDRNLILHHVKLTGKKKSQQKLAASELTEAHKRIIRAVPTGDDDREKVTRAVIGPLASLAFRRPVDDLSLQRLVDLSLSVQDEGGSFEESIQVALQAILVSPRFLFRVEPPAGGFDLKQYRELDEFELATRLSYFLWSSMPDKELLSLAVRGELRKGNNLERQIARMMRDARANEFVSNFAGQWLTLRKLRDFSPDESAFPKWNERIKQQAMNETYNFFRTVMQRNMSVLTLLDADFTFLNEELAGFYGVPGVVGPEFRPVSLKGTHRSGLLTHASVLAVTSNPTRTSPVKRGKWILDNLLAKPPPPAPPGVPELEEKNGQLTGTLRERLEQHRADPACANCHKLMDPLGFALENFDAVGLYRTKDGSLPIDASGELPGGAKVQGADELIGLLVSQHKRDFVECLTEKMLTYALGRGLEYYDKCAVDQIVQSIEDENYRFSALLVGIVRSDPFQKKGEREIE